MSAFSAIDSATEYVSRDPNEETRNAVADLLKNEKFSELEAILGSRLQFGTAGLRGPMGPGYNRMNDLVVLQTCQGLIRCIESLDSSAKSKGVVIGYDHRALGALSSRGFARISAAVFLSQGYKTYLLEDLVATPFVAFGVKHLGCAAGIMVTASHNPKADNGYKVYWNTGSQIVPPHDTGIAAAIDANLAPWQVYDTSAEAVFGHALAENVTERVAKAYFAAIETLSEEKGRNSENPVKAVYTAMHGVGYQWVQQAFAAFHHAAVDAVPLQAQPDPEFPTVKFPNPEEKGALNESVAYAGAQGASLILANDPDADRLAVAERVSAASSGELKDWYVFSGNELGVLLGYWQIQRWRREHPGESAALLASIVSSRMLKAIATQEGMIYHDTLTGFKWLGDCAINLRATGTPVIFMYEEALGYCLGDVLCDKDGISAASMFLEMAGVLMRERGLTVKQHLQQLYTTYGEFVSYNSYVISHDKSVTQKLFHQLRTAGPSGSYWTECAGAKIVAIKDITVGYDSTTADLKSPLPVTPESEMIMFEFDNGVSVTLRTSGTEPKIKYYTEIAGRPGAPRDLAQGVLHTFVDNLVNEMLHPDEYGLTRA